MLVCVRACVRTLPHSVGHHQEAGDAASPWPQHTPRSWFLTTALCRGQRWPSQAGAGEGPEPGASAGSRRGPDRRPRVPRTGEPARGAAPAQRRPSTQQTRLCPGRKWPHASGLPRRVVSMWPDSIQVRVDLAFPVVGVDCGRGCVDQFWFEHLLSLIGLKINMKR